MLDKLDKLDYLENIPQDIPDDTRNDTSEGIVAGAVPKTKKRKFGKALFTLATLIAIGGIGVGVTHNITKPKQEKPSRSARLRNVPVLVAQVTTKSIPVQLQAIGNVQAYNTVSVTPQAGGQITGIFFKKGQDVKKGQLLFTLDPRTQEAAIDQVKGTIQKDLAQIQQARATYQKDLTIVEQAKANLAKDQAQAAFAQAQSNRYSSLLKEGAVTQADTQQYQANALAASAGLNADKQAIANAQSQLGVDKAAIQNAQSVLASDTAALKAATVQATYTKIYSPIDGRAGDILVTQGNVVQANNNTTPLVKINQIHPIQVSFSIPEKDLPLIQKYASGSKLPVNVTFPNSKRTVSGLLNFVNNTVDSTTGTIQLIGTFDNAEENLFPGQYVNATLTLTTKQNAIVVPDQAVQQGPNGKFVFVVDTDTNKVKNVPVTTGDSYNGFDEITQGVKVGDTVVIDGQSNLVDGSKVQIKTDINGGQKQQGDIFNESF